MPMIIRLLLICLAVGAGNASAVPHPEMQLCASNQGDYPWVIPERPGLNQLLIERAALRAHIVVRFHSMPWGQCLLRLSTGRMDGAFNSSFLPERLAFARYPMRDGKLDDSRRLMRSGYSLYYRKGSNLNWDGESLSADGVAGVPSGSFAITRRLQDVGVTNINQQKKQPAQIFDALLEGEFAVAALKSEEGRHLLKTNAVYREHLEQHPLPLHEKNFFLIFSRKYMQQNSLLAERMWAAIAAERESPEYQELVRDFR